MRTAARMLMHNYRKSMEGSGTMRGMESTMRNTQNNRPYDEPMRSEGGADMRGSYEDPSAHSREDRPHEDRSDKHEQAEPKTEKSQIGFQSEEHGEFTRDMAEKWVEQMEYADGSKGQHWKWEQAEGLMKQCGVKCDPAVWYAVLNNTFRLYSKIARKFGLDRPDFYCDLAKAWIEDADRMAEKCEKMIRKAKEK